MITIAPSLEIQRELLNRQISDHQQEYWKATTLAKAYKKAGLDEPAKKQAEAAASLERVVDALDEELKALV